MERGQSLFDLAPLNVLKVFCRIYKYYYEYIHKGSIFMSLFLKPDLYNMFSSLYSKERIMENIETLKKLEKPRGYSTFSNSTLWCEDVLKKAGFSDVCRIAHKADGKTSSYDFIMPPAWDICDRCTLEIVEPESEIIADSDISTIFVAEYAAPTPEGGVTAELVDYADLDPEKPDCEGKFVLHRGTPPVTHPLYKTLANAGCAGIVVAAFETAEHEPDAPSWINGHGHVGWYPFKEESILPIFCVTPKTGIKLIELLSKGKVVLHGEMNTKVYDGEIYTVTATIPGKSDDEFAVLGHLYEPFKTDDCQGFAVGVEVAIMLKELIDTGVLPKPEKTLRLIFSMERYGYAAFFANHNKRILAATSIDSMTCQASKVLNIGFAIVEAPLSCPFFGDMLFNEAMNSFCPDVKWRFRPGTLSDDCWMGEKTVDIPTNWCISSSKDGRSDYHHCDAPIFDDVQPEVLEKLVPMLATYLAVMICGDRKHFEEMAVELEKTAAYWLEIKKNFNAGKTAIGKIDKREALWSNKAAEMLYLGRMESFNRFYSGIVTPTLPKHWADDFYNILPERELTPVEKKADGIRYCIKYTGIPFSQARVPASERVSWPMASELMLALLAPERSVLDVIRLHDAALSCNTSDEMIESHLDYFNFLAKYGYLEEVK